MFSKRKLENIFCLGFNCISISLDFFTMAASNIKIAVEHTNSSQVMCCIYSFFLAGLLIPAEFKTIEKITFNIKFNTNDRGRGVIVGLFGCIVLGWQVFLLVAGILDLVFGFACIIFSFLSAIPPPKSIVDNWQNWQEFLCRGTRFRLSKRRRKETTRTLYISFIENKSDLGSN